jgi:hypothetical protein
MRRFTRCLVALAIGATGLFAMQQPASAVAAAAVVGGGYMASASGPSLTGTAVSGTISGTAVGTSFGACTMSGSFNGVESLVAGYGYGTFSCAFPCSFTYNRVGHEMVMNGACGSMSFSAGGFAEPNSVLPTTSYLFQLAGNESPPGVIALQGNLSFSPGAPIGVDPGNVTQVNTTINFSGTMYGTFNGAIPSCSFNFNGTGFESFALGSAAFNGTCSGPGFSDPCNIQWTHVATHTFLTGNCFGFVLNGTVIGTGELVLTGNTFSFVGEVNII